MSASISGNAAEASSDPRQPAALISSNVYQDKQPCSALQTKQIIDRVYAKHGPLLVSSPAANESADGDTEIFVRLNAYTLHLTAYARALKDKKHMTAAKALED